MANANNAVKIIFENFLHSGFLLSTSGVRRCRGIFLFFQKCKEKKNFNKNVHRNMNFIYTCSCLTYGLVKNTRKKPLKTTFHIEIVPNHIEGEKKTIFIEECNHSSCNTSSILLKAKAHKFNPLQFFLFCKFKSILVEIENDLFVVFILWNRININVANIYICIFDRRRRTAKIIINENKKKRQWEWSFLSSLYLDYLFMVQTHRLNYIFVYVCVCLLLNAIA